MAAGNHLLGRRHAQPDAVRRFPAVMRAIPQARVVEALWNAPPGP